MADEIAIAALIISVAAIVPSYYNLFVHRAEKHRIEFDLQRVNIRSTSPIQSDWTVRILHPTKTIDHCRVEIRWGKGNERWLPVSDRTTEIYDIQIPKMGGMNFQVPKGVVPEGSMVTIKDGNKTIRSGNAQDIPLTNP